MRHNLSAVPCRCPGSSQVTKQGSTKHRWITQLSSLRSRTLPLLCNGISLVFTHVKLISQKASISEDTLPFLLSTRGGQGLSRGPRSPLDSDQGSPFWHVTPYPAVIRFFMDATHQWFTSHYATICGGAKAPRVGFIFIFPRGAKALFLRSVSVHLHRGAKAPCVDPIIFIRGAKALF